MVAIIDYGAGNLRSVTNAIDNLGYQPKLVTGTSDVLDAEVVILPGVGAAADTMSSLEQLGLLAAIRRRIAEGSPFFGVCMGLQVLLTTSDEGGGCACLDIIPGRVKKLPAGLKVPHMGWNQVKQNVSHPVFDGIPDEANFYFVHSFYVDPENKTVIAGETDYGVTFCSMIIRGNLVASQFHPEKSGELGLKLYDNFIKFAEAGGRGGG